jgi:hypothetical protein
MADGVSTTLRLESFETDVFAQSAPAALAVSSTVSTV